MIAMPLSWVGGLKARLKEDRGEQLTHREKIARLSRRERLIEKMIEENREV